MDTICAIATAQGGAIGVIRVSGPDAITFTDKIFTPATSSLPLAKRKPYTITFGHIHNAQGEIIDEVLISLFLAPHSYTGENSTEISCHGSPYILQQIMQLLINSGCRTAHPGEYTQRAFLNGKMDLSQAEAVADLVASTSEAAHRLAMNQMRGGFSRELSKLREHLLHLTSLMELELDFSDHEDLEFANRTELKTLAKQIEKLICKLANSFSTGNAIKNGIPVAIIGETNAGKSTLLNALLNEDKAIVSDIHGTTRDIIEDTVNIQGVTFRFIDTAGIRNTTDSIETLGIERSFRAISQAQIIIIVYDITGTQAEFQTFLTKINPHLKNKHTIIAFNKCDLPNKTNFALATEIPSLEISAKQGLHIEQLQTMLMAFSHFPQINQADVIVTNVRHYEALIRAQQSIHRVQIALSVNMPEDLISQDLRECIFHLSDILGEVTNNEVLSKIFSKFCIGK